MGIAHLRYPTAGTSSVCCLQRLGAPVTLCCIPRCIQQLLTATKSAESQPFYVNSPYGIWYVSFVE